MNNIILAITLVVAFFMCIKAYCLGYKHGKGVSNAIAPTVNINPIKTFKQYAEVKEKKKERDLVQEGMNAIATYDPYNVKEGE